MCGYVSKGLRNSLLAANAEKSRRRAIENGRVWSVYCLKKNGERYKKPTVELLSESEATAKVAYLEQVNPGSKFVAVKEATY